MTMVLCQRYMSSYFFKKQSKTLVLQGKNKINCFFVLEKFDKEKLISTHMIFFHLNFKNFNSNSLQSRLLTPSSQFYN